MSLLSVTFYVPNDSSVEWNSYLKNEFNLLLENLMSVEKYFFSVVESDFVSEGENYNLLLFFEDVELRELFIINELKNITDRITLKFGSSIDHFITYLNPIFSRKS